MSSPEEKLPRQLGLWSAIAMMIGSTIGSGIFRTPAKIATLMPGPLPLLGVWVCGGLFALCGALTLAEIAGAFPQTGGVYVFLREAWGRRWAFLFGWAELVVIRAASYGAISTTFSEYFLRVLGYDPGAAPASTYVHWIAAVAIAITATFNVLGLRWGSLIQNLTTAAKYGGLLFIIVLAFALGLPQSGGHFTPLIPAGSFHIGAFGLALVSVLWAYDGFEDVTFVAGEVRDPRRVMPRAIITGTIAVVAIYLLANLAYLSVLDVSGIAHSRLVAADVAQRLIGSAGVVFVSVTVMLSTFGTLNGSILTSPRIFFAMADDGLLFSAIGRVHPRYRSPYRAIMLSAFLGIAFVMTRTFEQLADTFVTAIVPFLALAVLGVFRLRKRADYDPPFRVPGYPVVPLLFIVSTAALLINAIIDESSRVPTLVVLGVVLLGLPVYSLTVGRRSAVS